VSPAALRVNSSLTPGRRSFVSALPAGAEGGEHAREDEGALGGDDAEGYQHDDRDVSFEQECPVYEDRHLPAEDYGQRPPPASTVGDEIPDVVGEQDSGHGSTNRQRCQRHVRWETTSLHGVGDDDDQNPHKEEHRGLAGGGVGDRARSCRVEVAAERREAPECEDGPAAHSYQIDAEKQGQGVAKQRTRKDAGRTHATTYYRAGDTDRPGYVETALRIVELIEHVRSRLYEEASEEHGEERPPGERAVLERQRRSEEHRHSRRS
jgi:hypothetical protein